MLDEKEGSNLAGCRFCLSQTSSPKNWSTVFGLEELSDVTFCLLTSAVGESAIQKTELGYPAAAADTDKTALGNVLDRLLGWRIQVKPPWRKMATSKYPWP